MGKAPVRRMVTQNNHVFAVFIRHIQVGDRSPKVGLRSIGVFENETASQPFCVAGTFVP